MPDLLERRLHAPDQRKRRLADGRDGRPRPRGRRLGRDRAPSPPGRPVVRRARRTRRTAPGWWSAGPPTGRRQRDAGRRVAQRQQRLGRRAGLDLPRRGAGPPRPRLGRGVGAVHRRRGRLGRGRRRRRALRAQGGRPGAVRRPRRTRATPTPTTSTPRSPAASPPTLDASCVLAVGESQSAFALTTYVNARARAGRPLRRVPDPQPPRLGDAARRAGCGIDLADRIGAGPTPVRDDADVPVIIVQTEGDLFGRLAYLPARQPDSALLRLWEVAGAAHADRFQIGEFESFLGCPDPVNRGPAGLRRARGAALAGVVGAGRACGAVRAPAVGGRRRLRARRRRQRASAASGRRWSTRRSRCCPASPRPDASPICALFGRTLPLPASVLAERWPSRAAYLAAYSAATDAAIAAGFVLAEDRDAVLAEARPDLLPA